MNKYTKIKSEALEMSINKAQHRLRKNIMFSMMQRLNEDNCYRCGEKIVDINTLSIEHKTSWLYSEDPKKLFWDLDNIAFSHLKCNISHSNLGKTMSEEARKNISIGHMGHKRTKESIEKTRLANIGRKHTKETKEKMRNAKLGKRRAPNHGAWL